jgi:ribonuclease HII
MVDRVTVLLDFDLALVDSIAGGRPASSLEEVAACLPDLKGTAGSIRFVGFDEAGRGALAGPVAVACVHLDLPSGRRSSELDREAIVSLLAGLDDSKRLTPRRRGALYEAIVSVADWGIGCASAAEIDRFGIVRACRIAARRAYAKMPVTSDLGLFDRGLSLAGEGTAIGPAEIQITHGDARSLHVAAASIVAKVGRDAIMEKLDPRFPGYGLSGHKGYGTAAHREAIRRLGPSLVHRRSFCARIETAESQTC